MTDVMIDIETLSVYPDAVILTLGAVKFNRHDSLKSLKESNTFYRRISIQSCLDIGLSQSDETLSWWLNQHPDVRFEALENKDRISIQETLKEFSKWFYGSTKIWGHGDDFDCVILSAAYKACGMKIPWKFWNTRDTRTIFDIASVKLKDFNNKHAHHALHDAYTQVMGVKKALNILSVCKYCM